MQEVAGTEAFGKPGIEPRWTHSNKEGVGTAYSASSHLWFTIWNGIVTEVYYPTIDRPQLRDLQYLMTDGSTFFQEEKRDLKIAVERISDHALGYRCSNSDPDGRYTIVKDIIGDPHPLVCCKGREFWETMNRSSPPLSFMLFVLLISRSAALETTPISPSPTVNAFSWRKKAVNGWRWARAFRFHACRAGT